MSLDQTVSELRNEISELRRALFIGASAMLAGVMLWNLSMFSPISWLNPARMEKIFEDMLGSRDKLPELTKLVIHYCGAAGGLLPVAVIISFTLVAWSFMSLNRNNGRFLWIALIGGCVLAFHRGIIALAIEMPLWQIIQGLNEKS